MADDPAPLVGLQPSSYEVGKDEYVPPLFALPGDYEEAEFEFETGSHRLHQAVTGWREGGCDILWSMVMPATVALNLDRLVGRTVLELGAGCGLVGLIAAQTASHVVITDGDVPEVALCTDNAARHAPSHARVEAAHLAWGARPSQQAQAEGRLGGCRAFDVIIASQVVYVLACIPALVETFATLLAPDGEVWLYNDRVSYSLGPDGQTECRACLDKALASHGLAATADTCLRLPRDFDELPSHAYLLRITRAPSA